MSDAVSERSDRIEMVRGMRFVEGGPTVGESLDAVKRDVDYWKDRYDKAQARVEELETVMRWYADDGVHAPLGHSTEGWCRDSGHRARLILGLPSKDE